jgi:hypothetical protein
VLTQSEIISSFNKTEYETNLYASVENLAISANELYQLKNLAKNEIEYFSVAPINFERVSPILINSTLSSVATYHVAEKSDQDQTSWTIYEEKGNWAWATLALIGFAMSIIGIFAPLGVAASAALEAILAGSFVLMEINGKHWYKGFAIAGLIIGAIVGIVVVVAIL